MGAEWKGEVLGSGLHENSGGSVWEGEDLWELWKAPE